MLCLLGTVRARSSAPCLRLRHQPGPRTRRRCADGDLDSPVDRPADVQRLTADRSPPSSSRGRRSYALFAGLTGLVAVVCALAPAARARASVNEPTVSWPRIPRGQAASLSLTTYPAPGRGP